MKWTQVYEKVVAQELREDYIKDYLIHIRESIKKRLNLPRYVPKKEKTTYQKLNHPVSFKACATNMHTYFSLLSPT